MLQSGGDSISQPATPVRAAPPSSPSDLFITPRTSPSQPLHPASASAPLCNDDFFGVGDADMGDASMDLGTSSTNPDPTPQKAPVWAVRYEEMQRENKELKRQVLMLQQHQQQQLQPSASAASTTTITKDVVTKEADILKAQGSSTTTTTQVNEKDQLPGSKKVPDVFSKRNAEERPQSRLNDSSVSTAIKISEGAGIQKENVQSLLTAAVRKPAKGKEKEQHAASAFTPSVTAAKSKAKEVTSSTATGARGKEEQEQARQQWMEYVQEDLYQQLHTNRVHPRQK
ncbi:hypothetical protein MPER_08492 [Moniliophthora perniciosa FA553]|nr:hypothetical protein MPER_08492 [Moniliophthora perniciosa FA553]